MDFVLGLVAGGGLGMLTTFAIVRLKLGQFERRRLAELQHYRAVLRA